MKFPDFPIIFSKKVDFPWLSRKRDFDIPWFSLIFPDAGHPGLLSERRRREPKKKYEPRACDRFFSSIQ